MTQHGLNIFAHVIAKKLAENTLAIEMLFAKFDKVFHQFFFAIQYMYLVKPYFKGFTGAVW